MVLGSRAPTNTIIRVIRVSVAIYGLCKKATMEQRFGLKLLKTFFSFPTHASRVDMLWGVKTTIVRQLRSLLIFKLLLRVLVSL